MADRDVVDQGDAEDQSVPLSQPESTDSYVVVPSPPAAEPHDTQQLHIISEELELSNNVAEWIADKSGLAKCGLDYHIVAIFGSQSTGKSTLLNALFGTDYSVMGHERQQTTKGLWLSTSNIPGVLVMDVEGTDGRERGEDQNMERKSALFSLAVADVLIVNMFEHDVGRYQGANYGLLKTVFEVNLGQFQTSRPTRTLLQFVIRDCNSGALENLAAILRKDMARIWAELRKPAGLEDAQMERYFELRFAGLPHKMYEAAAFASNVADMRKWFADASHPSYVFASEFHKKVPIDGLAHFAGDIWEMITNNKDLDLPTQRQLLAQFRCSEIGRAVHDDLAASLAPLLASLERGQVVADLGAQLAALNDTAMSQFASQASVYDPTVYASHRASLAEALHASLFVAFSGQLRNAERATVRRFGERLTALCAERPSAFAENVAEARAEALQSFTESVRGCVLAGTGWSTADAEEHVREAIDEVTAKRRADAMRTTVEELKGVLALQLMDPIAVALQEGAPNMWTEVQEVLNVQTENLKRLTESKLKAFAAPADEVAQVRASLHLFVAEQLARKAADATADAQLVARLRQTFARAFRKDESGRPRQFQEGVPIDALFDAAVAHAKAQLDLYCDVKLDLAGPLGSTAAAAMPAVLVTKVRGAQVWQIFRDEADTQYDEVKRMIIQQRTHLPTWVYVIILLLGADEFLDAVSNPAKYLFYALLAGAAYYAYFQSGYKETIDELYAEIVAKLRSLAVSATVKTASHIASSAITPSAGNSAARASSSAQKTKSE